MFLSLDMDKKKSGNQNYDGIEQHISPESQIQNKSIFMPKGTVINNSYKFNVIKIRPFVSLIDFFGTHELQKQTESEMKGPILIKLVQIILL